MSSVETLNSSFLCGIVKAQLRGHGRKPEGWARLLRVEEAADVNSVCLQAASPI